VKFRVSSVASSPDCLSSECVDRLRTGESPPEELARVEQHLDECPACRGALDEAAADPAGWAELRVSLSDGLPADHSADEGPSLEQVMKMLGPTDDPRMLGRVGTYEIVGVLGRGGMGVVFKGFDAALNRYVAIKLLQPHLAASGAARQRFAREAQAAAAVVDDNVMAIHGVAEWQGVPYLVMPYTRGVSLQKRLTSEGPLELREILRIGMQTAAGLAAAHAQGLVHRDVKPANILLADGVERVTLTDFGLARAVDDASLTRTGILAGTPQYMSPEQARGQTVDSRSDLFSLGSVLYALATGRPPFRAESSYAVLRLITDEQPRPIRELNPDMPDWLCRIIGRLMAKRPEDRYSTAREVADLLEKCLAHVQQPTTAPMPAELVRVPKLSRLFLSRKALTMVATLGICVLGLFAWQATAPPDIAGEWQGEEWGRVTLKATGEDEYVGTYTDTFGQQPGQIRLKWSRVERRYNGTWKESDARLGEISVRLVGEEVRGAWTADAKSKINPNTPHLADLLWIRAGSGDPRTTPPVVARSPDRATGPTAGLPAGGPPGGGGRPAVAGSAGSGDPRTAAATSPQRFNYFTTGHSIHVACSADGKLIAVANGNPTRILQVGGTSRLKGNWKATVDILDAATEKTVVSLQVTGAAEEAALSAIPRMTHAEGTALAFSPAGDAIAVGTSIGQVKLFDPRTGKLILSLDDSSARLADKDTPESWKPLPRALGSVESLAFSPDGSLLAVCGGTFGNFADAFDGISRLTREVTGPGRLKIFDVKTGKLKHDLVGHSHPDKIAFSPNGTLLASAGRWSSDSDNGTGVILWNPDTGKKVRVVVSEANGGISAVAFSPNGKLLVIGSEMFDKDSERGSTKITLAHTATGIVEWQRSISGWANPKAFSPDGKSVLVLAGQSIRFLDVTSGAVQREIKSSDLSKDGRWDDFATAPPSKLVIGAVDEQEGSLEIWDLVAPAPVATRSGDRDTSPTAGPVLLFRTYQKDAVTTLRFSPDGSKLAANNGHDFALFDGRTGKELWSTKMLTPWMEGEIEKSIQRNKRDQPLEVRTLAFSPDGARVVVGHSLGSVTLFNVETGSRFRVIRDSSDRLQERRAIGCPWSLSFSPDGKLLAVCGDSFAAVSSTRDLGLRGDEGGLFKIFDVETGEKKQDLLGHSSQGLDVAFSPDGKLLATAGNWSGPDAGSGVKLWDPQTGELKHTIPVEHTALSLAFSPSGEFLAIGTLRNDKSTGMSQGSIYVVRTASGKVELNWQTPIAIRPLAFSPDGKLLAAASSKNVVTLYDAKTGQAVGEVRPSQTAAAVRIEYFAFAPSGLSLAIGGMDPERGGFIEVWKLSAENAKPVATPTVKQVRVNKEQVDRIKELIKDAPVTTSYLAEIWEVVPGTQAEYRVRKDITAVELLPAGDAPIEVKRLDLLPAGDAQLDFVLGTAYFTVSKGVYLQWDAIGASTRHYYGPFYGDKLKQLGIDLEK